jgi:hypothetical protein
MLFLKTNNVVEQRLFHKIYGYSKIENLINSSKVSYEITTYIATFYDSNLLTLIYKKISLQMDKKSHTPSI